MSLPAFSPSVPATDDGRALARRALAAVLERHREDIAAAWLQSAGYEGGVRFPDLARYLRSLISGLHEVFRHDEWTLTQTIIDGLAERRARVGVGLEQGLQRALLAGRHAIRRFYPERHRDTCDELLLEALHECVFRFAESYQGLRLASENDRMQTRIIKSLVMALEAREPHAKGHAISVALLSQRIAVAMGERGADPARAFLGGLLHDVGKVGIPDSILLKPAPLSRDEWDVMRTHPTMGASILRPVHLYPDVVAGVLAHHEDYAGTGYPRGLGGEEIPMLARIIRVTDSFDAITSTRVHRSSRSSEDAIAELMGERGKRYDPDVVDTFVGVVEMPGIMRELSLASLQIDMGDFSLSEVG